MKLFFIIPAYNEEGNIIKLLTDIKDLSLTIPKKVILIDDGSTDQTKKLVESFKDQLDLEIIVHSKNCGVPQTFFDGFTSASRQAQDDDILVMVEGDNTSDLKLIPLMIERMGAGADLVVASRYIKGGAYKNFPLRRTLGSNILNITLKLFFRIKGLTDYTIFYRAYRAKIVRQALTKHQDRFITTKSFAANMEVLLRVKEFAQRLDEVPLVYDYGLKKSQSKMNVTKTLFEYKDLLIKKIIGKV